MSDKIKVFFIEPIDRERRWLRRFSLSSEHKCGKTGGYCNAKFELGEADILYTPDGFIDASAREVVPPRSDPRWPTACEACGRAFAEKDEYQILSRQIYIRPETGLRCTLDDAPVGACWDAWWVHHRNLRNGEEPAVPGVGSTVGPDGRSLVVRCPDGHDWMIDSRCSNCTLPKDNTHHCWVRHGKPEDGTLTVDKKGKTCSAGGGSIQTGKWHGFLSNGEFIKC